MKPTCGILSFVLLLTSTLHAQDGGLEAVKTGPDAFAGTFRDATGARNFVVKATGSNRFTISCEDWEGEMAWGKNMGGCAGIFRYLDEPQVETNAVFRKGGEFQNAVGFLQMRLLNTGAYELKFRWWLDDVEQAWYYQIEKVQ
ncbi:MAG: hypothetical protein AAGF67_04740 [Verrucomicrobiota bacterium]